MSAGEPNFLDVGDVYGDWTSFREYLGSFPDGDAAADLCFSARSVVLFFVVYLRWWRVCNSCNHFHPVFVQREGMAKDASMLGRRREKTRFSEDLGT